MHCEKHSYLTQRTGKTLQALLIITRGLGGWRGRPIADQIPWSIPGQYHF